MNGTSHAFQERAQSIFANAHPPELPSMGHSSEQQSTPTTLKHINQDWINSMNIAKSMIILFLCMSAIQARALEQTRSRDVGAPDMVDIYVSEESFKAKVPDYAGVSISWFRIKNTVFLNIKTTDGSVVWLNATEVCLIMGSSIQSNTLKQAKAGDKKNGNY